MIKKSATNKKEFNNNLLFTINARAAWEHILVNLKHGNVVPSVLMPSYIGQTEREGSGVFDPIRQQDVYAEFYKINDDLSVNIQDFKERLQSKKFNCVLIIHYFGFCRNDMQFIKSLCSDNNAILIEDCAHAFHLHETNPSLGEFGDYSFYSLHKYLATEQGGILKINSCRIPEVPLLQDKKISLEDLQNYASAKFKEIANKRRENFRTYEESFIFDDTDIKSMYLLTDDDIPQTFPVRVKKNKREKLYFYLMERNAPTVALYYRLINEIDRHEFQLSYTIAEEILNLPVHQDTNKEDIFEVCTLIRRFIENES